jgi:class 3 adenylate cyclase
MMLFADLKGPMELLREPEDARAILNPGRERMMAAIHRYEGPLNQVMGNGIMALCGAPIVYEDHAVRACYATLAMQLAIAIPTVRTSLWPTGRCLKSKCRSSRAPLDVLEWFSWSF